MHLERSLRAVALAVSTILSAVSAAADEELDLAAPLEEVIVTAQKRVEDVQHVAASIQVLDTRKLQDLEVNGFDDYAKYLPSVSSQNFGPGQENLVIRGVTNGTDGPVIGSQPTVAVYLDEQPVTTIGANLDVHIYDIARVEELSGPQGTLFGSSSMAGTLRIITNKPSTAGFEAGYDFNVDAMPAGSPGGTIQGFVNLPVDGRAAIRLVAFSEYDGGYINNVLGPPETYPTSGAIRSNAGLTQAHYNGVATSGGRAALKVDLTDSWTVTPSFIGQQQTANGIPAYEPALGDLNVARYFPEKHVDRWYQAALTIEGKIADFDLVYAGAYLDRTVHGEVDYSQYSLDYDRFYQPEFGEYFRDNAGKLIAPAEYALHSDDYEKVSHELRLLSPSIWPLRFVAGLFLQHQLDDIGDEYRYEGLGTAESISGEPGVNYLNAMSRVDRDRAAFAEITYELTRRLSLTTGLREFGYDNSLYGFFGYPYQEALCAPGSALIAGPGRPCIDVNQRSTKSGSTYKVALSYRLDSQRMLYGTWSTGFRPGGINRSPDVPSYGPDSLVDFEVGWKTQWWQHRLRFNGAVFFERWKNPQFNICGPGCVIEVINAGGAGIRGSEVELEWSVTSGLTVGGAGTWLDARLTANACQYGNAGSDCRNSAGIADPAVLPVASAGDQLPAPKFKGNLVTRYTFAVGSLGAHVQVAAVTVSALPTGIPSIAGGLRAGNSPPYTSVDLTSGLSADAWEGELYLKNALDRRGEENRGLPCSVATCDQLFVMPIPPRTIGVSFRRTFQ